VPHPAGPLRGITRNHTLLAQLHDEGGRDAASRLRRAGRGEEPVAAPGQEQVWFFDRLTPEALFHTIALRVSINGPLDTGALRAALAAIVARHAPLRTAFTMDDGRLVPVPVAEAKPALAEHDLAGLGEAQRVAAVERLAAAELERPFDLSRGPLLRGMLAHRSHDDHTLLLTLHHIAADGHSLPVLSRELVSGYADLVAGRMPDLPELPLQYSDVARWQRELLDGDEAGTHLAYWRQTLAALPPPPALVPPTGSRPPLDVADDFRGDVVDLTVPADLCASAQRLAGTEQASTFMVLLAAFAVLLRRYSGATDLIVGTPAGGRQLPGTEDLIGYLVNMLPLRLRLDTDPTCRQVLAGVRDACLDAFAHQDLPFQEVVRAVQPERRPGVHPIFQVVFASPPPVAGTHTAGPTTFRFEQGTSAQALYDLEVQLPATAGDRHGFIKYRTARFSRDRVAALAAHYVRMLEQFVSDPDQHLSNLSPLSAAEREQVVATWNDSTTPYPRDRSLGALFEWQADRSPDAPALRFGDVALNYRELDEKANQLAHALLRLGVGAEGRVGLCLGHGPDWVIGALAAIKAGAAYVPLDPDYPPDRLAYMAADSGAQVVLVHSTTTDRLAGNGLHLIDVDAAAPAIAAGPRTRPAGAADPNNLAYIMYTSGSTGRPKGVAVTHRNVVRLVRGVDYVDFRPQDSVAQCSNISFDAATFEVWGALLNGARLVGLTRDETLDAARLAERVRAERIDTLFLTTSLGMQVARDHPEALRHLRSFVFGGEQANLHALRTLLAHGAPARVVNGYGPTETTTFAAAYECHDLRPDDAVVPIGRPLSNTTLYVLDEFLDPAPPGVVGELYIGGDGVARGYVNRPDLTADRFVPDHLGGVPGSRSYRTGDLARHRSDGTIEVLGRADRQIKIRGFRIEPGEIEDCLDRAGLVRQATVQAWRDAAGDTQLVGYIVPADAGVTAESVRAHLSARLPEYMVPVVLVPMPALPMTENGKLDVRALPDPADHLRDRAGTSAPSTPAERRIAAIWQDVLGLDEVGRQGEFFQLGGHSLKVTQVVTRVSAAFGIEVPLRLLFEHQTLADFAAAVDRLAAVPNDEAAAGPVRRTASGTRGSVADLVAALEETPDSDVGRLFETDHQEVTP
jgi:amino acid adenylation domain-containing protein